MRKFMSPARLWGTPNGPDADWVKPHVLWLPQNDPGVLDYFQRLREVVADYPDILTPVADEDLHMTIQSIKSRNALGERVDDAQLAKAAQRIQDELRGLDPFDIELGPPRAAGAAAVVDALPGEPLHELNRRVRAGALAAELVLPEAEHFFWGHMSVGYGTQNTDGPELAARSDQFASAIGRRTRPGSRTTATLSSVWLVWERQDVARNIYTFKAVHDLKLGA